MKLTTSIVILVASACSHGKTAQSGDPAAGAIAGAQNASITSYSCFSYSSGDASHKHVTCTATHDCAGVMSQVKGMSGMSDVTSCAAAPSVWCYHQSTKDGTDSGEVCQPSAEDCAQMRKDAIGAQQRVDGDCAQR